MARTERILALDIGASSIKAGEFEFQSPGAGTLVGFAHREYGEELTEGSRSVMIAALLRQLLVENNFTARKTLLSISGQSAFTRFVKLPPVADQEHRVRQIVEFEARQNVPFPMEDVIWDYQLIGNPASEELEVMFVVIKNEIVEQITGAVQAVGLQLEMVDVAPCACYNAARANHVGDESCAMILNIGGRSTNLLFADQNRFFARTIPIAGHSITQQIAKEFGIGYGEAEELKRRHGFVSLGGAYEEPESEVAAAVSKIIRNVMARLHGEISRSISVYRAQQKGNRPTSLFLTGGSSTMLYTDHFFAEKLGMEVSYLNPFQVVLLGPGLDLAALQEKAHMFSEVVGLALRHRHPCPVEVSLLPAAIRRERLFHYKKPYIVACLVSVLLFLFVWMLAGQRKVALYAGISEKMESFITNLVRLDKEIQREDREANALLDQYKAIKTVLHNREVWPNLLNHLLKLKPPEVWLEDLKLLRGEIKAEAGAKPSNDFGGGMLFESFGGRGGGSAPAAAKGPVTGIEITGHSVLLTPVGSGAQAVAPPPAPDSPEAPPPPGPGPEGRRVNPELFFLEQLRSSELFDGDPKITRIVTYTTSDVMRNYSTFVIVAKLKNPLPTGD